MTKRILSLVMVFCMMLSMVPAFAATTCSGTPVDGVHCADSYENHESSEMRRETKGTRYPNGCVNICNMCDGLIMKTGWDHTIAADGKPVSNLASYIDQKWVNENGQHKIICDFCKQDLTTAVDCSFNGDSKCDVCGFVCDAHNLTQADCTVAVVCPVCDVTVIAVKDHVAEEAVTGVQYSGKWYEVGSTHVQKCVACGKYFNSVANAGYATKEEAAAGADKHAGHDFSNKSNLVVNGTGHSVKCNYCPAMDAVQPHSYVGEEYKCACGVVCNHATLNVSEDGTKLECAVCDYSKANACTTGEHDFRITKYGKDAKCHADGSLTHGLTEEISCIKCGAVKQAQTEITAKHSYVKTVIDPAHCTTDGKWSLTCSVCGHTYYEVIDHTKDKEAHGTLEFVGYYSAYDPATKTGTYAYPTCFAAGKEAWVCTDCKTFVYYKTAAKLTHSGTAVVVDYVGKVAGVVPELNDKGEITNLDALKKADVLNCENGVFSYTECTNVIDQNGTKCGHAITKPTLIKNTAHDSHAWGTGYSIDATCTNEKAIAYDCTNLHCDVVKYVWTDASDVVHEAYNYEKPFTQYHTLDKAYNANKDSIEGAVPANATLEDYQALDVIVVVNAAPTCTEKGEIALYCSACKKQIAYKDGQWVDSTKSVTLPKLNHTNSKPTAAELAAAHANNHVIAGTQWSYTAPTCTTRGYWESNCANCNANYLKVEDTQCPLAHNFILGKVVGEANCEKEMYFQQVCKYCGLVMVDANGREVLEKKNPGEAHNWVISGAPIKAPTCSNPGYGKQVCSICGETKMAQIKETDDCEFTYTYKAATCEANASYGWYCAKCGEKKAGTDVFEKANSKLPHKFDAGTKITICGIEDTLIKYECINCDYWKVVKYEAGTANVNNLWIDSNIPYEVVGAGKQHSYGVEISKHSCTTDKVVDTAMCKVCGYVKPVAIANRYQYEAASHEPITQADGVTEIYTTETNCQGTFEKFTCKYCLQKVSVKVPNGTKDPAKHAELKYDYIYAPTCTKDGLGTAFCVACGWSQEEATTVPAKHSFSTEITVVVAPTCGKAGIGKFVCTACGAIDTSVGTNGLVSIPANNAHSFALKTVHSNYCGAASYVVYECSECGAAELNQANLTKLGYSYINNNAGITFTYWNDATCTTATKTLKNVIEEVAEVGDHKWGTAYHVAADCLHASGMREDCAYCDAYRVTADAPTAAHYQAALGHDAIFDIKEATCYEAGYYIVTCYRCGADLEGYDGPDAGTAADYPEYKKVDPAKPHNMVWDKNDTANVAATCSTTGVKVMKCSVCGFAANEQAPKADNAHAWTTVVEVRAASCKEYGLALQKCKLCDVGQRLNALDLAHVWDAGVVKTAATCAKEGEKVFTCTVDGCKATKSVVLSRTKHVMETKAQAADCLLPAGIITKCANCDLVTSFIKTGSKALGHIWSEKTFVAATCTTAGGHKIECLREGCGKTQLFEDKTVYPALAHKGKTKIDTVAPTCKNKGFDLFYCPICKTEIKDNYTNPIASKHVWKITYKYNQDVNCATAGYVDRECTECGLKQTKQYYKPDCANVVAIASEDVVYELCLDCGTITHIWTSGNFKGFAGCSYFTVESGNRVLKGAHKGLVVKAGKPGSCEEAGQIEHIECTVCKTVIQQGAEIPAHVVTVIAAKDATCTAEGNTAGKYCETCKKYIVEPKTIAKVAHTSVEVPAQAATATAPGHSAGKKCSVCGEILEGCEPTAKLGASVKRLCVVRSKAADYREDPTSVVVEMLAEGTKVTITGELTNEYYPVGEGRFIHMSYITVA